MATVADPLFRRRPVPTLPARVDEPRLAPSKMLLRDLIVGRRIPDENLRREVQAALGALKSEG